jgi:hypothetical protein
VVRETGDIAMFQKPKRNCKCGEASLNDQNKCDFLTPVNDFMPQPYKGEKLCNWDEAAGCILRHEYQSSFGPNNKFTMVK